MKCQICENPATFHLTEIVNKKKRKLHLCERCARDRNLIAEPPGTQLDLKALLNLIQQPFPQVGQHPAGSDEEVITAHGEDTIAQPHTEACEVCGLTLVEFKAEGRLGCPHDYESLRAALEPLLERIHRSTAHVGKGPRAVRVREWREQMQAAVAAEDYEEAARLRDLIRRSSNGQ